ISQFPTPIDYAIAYGSNVFPQSPSPSSPSPNKMTDLILAVPNTQTFHTSNLIHHPHHYPPPLSTLPPSLISKLNDHLGASISFHPYITISNTLLKYGVLTTSALIHDLRTWETMYLAGRFHKPVLVLKGNEGVEEARRRNVEGAVRVALLLLPGGFTEGAFYRIVVGLSYAGDVRMQVGGE
ncbi:mitochondrial matrix Mmp37, partial [Aspergillus sclerotiicarbonarius CBS 121057]